MTVWPQITYLVLVLMGAGVCLGRFGERKRDNYGWTDLGGPAIGIYLLYCGGFFASLGWAP